MHQIAQDQNGGFHVMNDGRHVSGPYDKAGDAVRASRMKGGRPSGSVIRIRYEAPEPTPEAVHRPEDPGPSAVEVIAGLNAKDAASTIAAGHADHALDAIEAADERVTVKRAVQKRRAALA